MPSHSTPSVSLYVDCSTEAELNGIVEALAKDGKFLMPLDNYGFSRRFAWLNDRFGVSWQINLA
ncbi:VOC family protein [Mesorhizobium sp. M0778]|uniref:VOC family protein n=1 Tax=Mesorhizobium sp. M0778 TaxID=2956999 RepID=UPI00333A13EA